MILFLIVLTSLSNAGATVALKYGDSAIRKVAVLSHIPKHLDMGAIVGVLCYFVSFLAYRELLSRLPASISYPLTTGIVILLISVVVTMFFGEQWTFQSLLGLGFVILGIVLIGGQVTG